MYKIKVQKLTTEAFAPFGNFTNILEPKGNCLGTFYNDQVIFPVSGNMPMAFSPLIISKETPMIVDKAEYHNTTGECMICIDDDIVYHVAPPTKDPVPELTQAFLIPKGTLVHINTGVWHLGPYPVNKEKAHVLIVLPERIYKNDCVVVDYDDQNKVEIEF